VNLLYKIIFILQQTEPESDGTSQVVTVTTTVSPLNQTASVSPSNTTDIVSNIGKGQGQPKRLHVSNIPFRFRDPDLRAMFGVCHCLSASLFLFYS